MHDVIVVGAGPSGALAAAHLASKQLSVLLLDRRSFPFTGKALIWLNKHALPLLDSAGVRLKHLPHSEVERVRFRAADLSKEAIPELEESPAWVVDRCDLDQHLVDAAIAAGVHFRPETTVTNIQLSDSGPVLTTQAGENFQGKMFLYAMGRGRKMFDLLGLRRDEGRPYHSAQVEADNPGGNKTSAGSMDIVLGLEKQGSFATVLSWGKRLAICLHWRSHPSEATQAFVALCQRLHRSGLVPLDFSGNASQAKFVKCPAAVALDMDTHILKHTLIIGDAGGFVSAVSNEGIYPAMWVSSMAADVMEKAIRNKSHSQDVLMTFDMEWRTQVADYLREPNTDIQFLLPLVFSNQPMANRMASAFFRGENI